MVVGGGAVVVRVRHAEVLESRVDASPLVLVVRLPVGDVPQSKDLRLNRSAICCLRTCCGDVATSTVKMECLRSAGRKSEVRTAGCWTVWKLS